MPSRAGICRWLPALLEDAAVGVTCVGPKHAIREALETERHIQGVSNGQAGREFELLQVGHGRAAVEAHGHALVVKLPGVTGGAGGPDLVVLAAACRGIDRRRSSARSRPASRRHSQPVSSTDRTMPAQVSSRRSCVAEAAQRGVVGVDGLGARSKAEALEIGRCPSSVGLAEQAQVRLVQRDEPGIGHRECRGALADMVEPVAILDRPILVEPVGRFGRRRVRQRRRQQLRELVGQSGLTRIGKCVSATRSAAPSAITTAAALPITRSARLPGRLPAGIRCARRPLDDSWRSTNNSPHPRRR